MILALNGADFGDFGKAVASAPVAAMQRAIRDFGSVIRDPALIKLAVDGLIGPKTAAAANRMLRQHIGAGQAPENLRTGVLTPAQVAASAAQITQLVTAEAHRRGFDTFVGPKALPPEPPAAKQARVATLQRTLKSFGKSVGDSVLAAIVADGKIGPKTTAAANRMLTKHLGVNQAPSDLRTGKLTQARVVIEATRITQLIEAEARRRVASAARPAAAPAPAAKPYVGGRTHVSTSTVARREPAAKAPVVQYIPPSQPAAQTPSYVPATTQVPSYTPTASATPVVIPATKTYVVPPSGGMDVEGIVKWAAIGLGVVALLGGAYFLISRRRGGGAAAPAVAGFLGFGAGDGIDNTEREQWINNDEGLYNWYRRESRTQKGGMRAFIQRNRAEIDAAIRSVRDRPPAQRSWLRGAGQDVNGYWQPIGYGGKVGPKFTSSFNAQGWINKNWKGEGTLQWIGKPRASEKYNEEARMYNRDLRERSRNKPFKVGLHGSGYYHTNPSEFTPGQRVQLHPGMSLWMQGARYGTVKKIGRDRVYVEIDATGKTVTIPPTRLQIED